MFLFAKILQAFGFANVGLGLFLGSRGDMWTELSMLLSGMGVFAVGRSLERWA